MEKCMEIAIKGKDYQTLVMQLQTRGVRFKIGNNPTRIILEEGWDLWKVMEALESIGCPKLAEENNDHAFDEPTKEEILKFIRSDGPVKTSEVAKHFNAAFSYVMGILDYSFNHGINTLTHDMTVYWLTETDLNHDIDRVIKELRENGPMRMGTYTCLFDDRWDANYMMALAIYMKKLDFVEWDYDPSTGKILLREKRRGSD
ncbi:MAG: hypothetical protein WC083_05150 [Candidatus Methanomethylophilaceae archaeon]